MPQKIIYRDEFAQAVKEAMGELNMSQAAYKTKISYEWVRKMAQQGHVPSEEVLKRLATGLNADLHALRVAAGYVQPTTVAETLKQQFAGRLPDDVLQNLVDFGATIDEQLERDNLHGESEEKQ